MSALSRVAVNLLWCVPGAVGGSEEYLARQLLGLAEVQPELDVTVLVPQGWVAAHPDVALHHRMVEAPIDGHSRPRRIVAEHRWLPRQTVGVDVVHHGGGTVPSGGRAPVVVTVHDLQWRTYPEYFGRVKRAYLGWAMPRSVRRAAVVAVPSEYVRGTVVSAYGIDPERVVVVPHGMESTLGHAATPPDVLRARYGLGEGPIVVYPAVTHPHKGHRFLLSVMRAYWSDPALRLVLTGGAGAAEGAVLVDIERLGLSDRVVRTGRVPGTDRDGLVRMATAVAFPSEYEGFGAPVVEAMALGAPVIASDRASLSEVVGGAGLVLPLDVEAWGAALDVVADRRAELIAAGHERARAFTAARSAEALLGAYRLALS